jgi:predicted GNAT family acetyltransferase
LHRLKKELTVAESPEVHHNIAAYRFEVTQDGHQAELDYTLAGNSIIFTHTEVPTALEGRGIGSAMARSALDYAIASQLDIVALCPFVHGYLERHPEYKITVRNTNGKQ